MRILIPRLSREQLFATVRSENRFDSRNSIEWLAVAYLAGKARGTRKVPIIMPVALPLVVQKIIQVYPYLAPTANEWLLVAVDSLDRRIRPAV